MDVQPVFNIYKIYHRIRRLMGTVESFEFEFDKLLWSKIFDESFELSRTTLFTVWCLSFKVVLFHLSFCKKKKE